MYILHYYHYIVPELPIIMRTQVGDLAFPAAQILAAEVAFPQESQDVARVGIAGSQRDNHNVQAAAG